MTRLPDFIIGGAPKCGTTSLHELLASNPAIGMPLEEVHYFDSDDPIAHPDFLFVRSDGVLAYDPDDRDGPLFQAYRRQFEPFQDRQLIGEDSTNYLFSQVAPARIRMLLPDVKFIFLIRDPVERTYSQYWHQISSGRASMSFEKALTRFPSLLLGSTYTPNLERYLETFGRDQILILEFGEFIRDMQTHYDRVMGFLGLGTRPIGKRSWDNRTLYPVDPRATRVLNFLGKHLAAHRYRSLLGSRTVKSRPLGEKLEWRWRRWIVRSTLRPGKAPPMLPATRAYLERHLSARNRGLGQLLGRDLTTLWPWYRGG